MKRLALILVALFATFFSTSVGTASAWLPPPTKPGLAPGWKQPPYPNLPPGFDQDYLPPGFDPQPQPLPPVAVDRARHGNGTPLVHVTISKGDWITIRDVPGGFYRAERQAP